MREEGERLCERRMRASDCERRLVPALISFRSAKKNRSAPNPVERRVLRQSIRPLLSVHYSVGLSAFRQAFRPLLGSLSSVRLSAFRRAFHPPLGSPPSVRRPALRRALRSLSGSLSSVGRSALRRALRLPSSVRFCVDRSEFSIQRSVFRLVLSHVSTAPSSVFRW